MEENEHNTWELHMFEFIPQVSSVSSNSSHLKVETSYKLETLMLPFPTQIQYIYVITVHASKDIGTKKWEININIYWNLIEQLDLPNNPKVITIKVPRLDGILIVLENNFKEVMEGSRQDRSAKICGTISRQALDGVETKDAGDIEIIC